MADYKDLAEQKGYTVTAEPRDKDWLITFTRFKQSPQLMEAYEKLHSELPRLIAQGVPYIDIKLRKEDATLQEEIRSTIFLMAQEQGYQISEKIDETYWRAELEKA